MKRLKAIAPRWLVLAALMLATACAAAPAKDTPGPDAALSQLEAEEVFATGLGSISEKYIVAHPAGDLAMDGLRGFATLDPALTVSRQGGRVILASTDGPIAAFPQPANDNVEGWAELMVKASRAGMLASEKMAGKMGKAANEKLYQAVFEAILADLDRFSRYAGAEAARRNRAKRDGFGGIGIRFRVRDGVVWITFIMPETPAARAGLKKNDVIVRVGGKILKASSASAVGKRLRGPAGSHLLLSVQRNGVPDKMKFDIERGHIVPPTVTYTFDKGVGILKISSFNQHTARSMSKMLKKAAKDEGAALKGIIIDLRGNPGGLLRQSVKVADLFLTQGRIITTRGRHPDSIQHYDAGGRDMAEGRPVVILVDGKSASASEIVAAALQDRGRAIIIGTTSFGKGTVQTVVRLPNSGEITLTWSRLITPSGYILHELGVQPTVCTSGFKIQGPKMIARALKQGFRTAASLESWREARFEDKARRQELRASCPAERRRTPFETEVAEWLIADKALYARALNLVAPATASAPAARK